jgi:preprotein translocase subunit YajC
MFQAAGVGCAEIIVLIMVVGLVVGGLFFLINLPDIERAIADQEWARAAQLEAKADIAFSRALTIVAIVGSFALLGVLGLVFTFVLLRSQRQPAQQVVYYVQAPPSIPVIREADGTELVVPHRPGVVTIPEEFRG